MNRREAQQQLAAVAQAIREGNVLTPHTYPILSIQTHAGISLWELSAANAIAENWSNNDAAEWYERDAIDTLVLDDE